MLWWHTLLLAAAVVTAVEIVDLLVEQRRAGRWPWLRRGEADGTLPRGRTFVAAWLLRLVIGATVAVAVAGVSTTWWVPVTLGMGAVFGLERLGSWILGSRRLGPAQSEVPAGRVTPAAAPGVGPEATATGPDGVAPVSP